MNVTGTDNKVYIVEPKANLGGASLGGANLSHAQLSGAMRADLAVSNPTALPPNCNCDRTPNQVPKLASK